jgi:hypothetical protein
MTQYTDEEIQTHTETLIERLLDPGWYSMSSRDPLRLLAADEIIRQRDEIKRLQALVDAANTTQRGEV